MPHTLLPNYLLRFRLQSGLSQAEVAALLGGRNGTRISRFERGTRVPDLQTALGLGVLYSAPVEGLFAGLSLQVEQHIRLTAAALLAELEADTAPATQLLNHRIDFLLQLVLELERRHGVHARDHSARHRA